MSELSQSRKRSELSWLNLAFCILVVWIHCASYPVTYMNREGWAFFLLYGAQRLSFVAVYGFYFVSGLKLTLPRSRRKTLLGYWKGRAMSILFPYCLSVTVYYAFFSLVQHQFPFSLSDLLGYMVQGDLAAHYYFLIALFQFILLAPLFYWLSKRWSPVILLPAAILFTQTCAQYLPDMLRVFLPGSDFQYNGILFTTYLFYYLAGCCAGHHYDQFIRLVKENRGLYDVVFVLSGAFLAYLFWLSATDRYYAPFLFPIHSLYIPAGILVCFQIALRLPETMPKWLSRLDQASYLIYLYHCLVLIYSDIHIQYLGALRISRVFLLRTLITFTVTPLACILWQYLWRKLRPKG